MTLGINSRNDYLGNNTTAVFPFTFKIRAESDLRVLKRDTSNHETVLVLNVDYTVSAAPWTAGGSLTLTAGNLPTGYRLVIRRVVPLSQTLNLRNQSAFFAEDLETALDEARRVDQQTNDDVDRSVKLAESAVPEAFDPTLPLDGMAANKVPIVNPAGTGWTWSTFVSGTVTTVLSLADTALTFLQAGAGAISRTGRAKLRDQVTVRDFGALGDGATNDGLAFTNGIAAHAGLIVPTSGADFVIGQNVTIPFGKTLKLEPGARISVSAGSTLTIHGAIEAPLSQHIFTGAGAVVITRAVEVPVTWFGALGDGSADAAPAFAKTLAAVADGVTIRIPNGSFLAEDTAMIIQNRGGVRVLGYGKASRVLWGGDATGPMFRVEGSHNCTLGHFTMTLVSTSFPVASFIVQEENAGGGFCNMNRYERLWADGLGEVTQIIYLKGDVTDQNNDFTTYDHCLFAGYTEAAAVLQGANCLENYFFNCQLAGQDTGKYGIKSITGAGGQAAHFKMFGGAALNHTEADYFLQTRCALPVVMEDAWSEGSQRLFVMPTGGGAACGIVFRDLYWASDGTEIEGTDDPWFIVIGVPGPVMMEGCLFGSDYGKELRMVWSYAGGFFAPSFIVRNTRILGSLSAGTEIFQGTFPTRVEGTYAQTGDTTSSVLFRMFLPNNRSINGRNAADTLDRALLMLDASDRVVLGSEGETRIQSTVTEIIRLVGAGLTWPSTPVPKADPRTMDDFRESETGEYEPALKGDTSESGQVYALQTGWFMRFSKLVVYGGEIQLSTLGTFTGDVYITLPTIAAPVNGGISDVDGVGGALIIPLAGMNTNVESFVATVSAGGDSKLTPYVKRAADSAVSRVTQADLTANTRIKFFGFFKALN